MPIPGSLCPLLAHTSVLVAPHSGQCPLGSRQLPAPAWQVFAGIVTRSALGPEAGVPVREIIAHPLYNDSSLDYDIALMRLQVPLNFSGQGLSQWCPSAVLVLSQYCPAAVRVLS